MPRRGLWFLLILALILAGGLFAWTERQSIIVWYYARQLGTADAAERQRLAQQLAAWEPLAIARLARQLESADAELCAGSTDVLLGWLTRRGGGDPRGEHVASVLVQRWDRLSPPGQAQTCRLVRELQARTLRDQQTKWQPLVGTLLKVAAPSAPDEALPFLLHLGWMMIEAPEGAAHGPACRQLALAGLKSQVAATRVLAVRLAAHPSLEAGQEVAARLKGPALDSAPEVRAMAIAVLGHSDHLLPTDDLLPFLHDADDEVRLLAEQALRGRGLSQPQVQLGKLMLHPDAAMRVRVPGQVLEMPELDVNLWLSRLTKDPAPAVRAAVARAVGDAAEPSLRPWLERLAEHDPNPTVQQLARYYLQMTAN
ncbi:MAG TPA: HEAT repeat domain-containing protein [Gemmatales bacterium]|nr:HEAT repeat domain-containing protein [Gemmatales bacterium]